MSLAAALWVENTDSAARILTHPFVRGLGDGTLPRASFERYVAQDAYFLEAFARAYGFCLAHSTARDDLYGFAELIGGVIDELKLHKGFAELWNVDLVGVTPAPATRAYTDFLLETAKHGVLGDTIAAMTPCMRLYAWLGQCLAKGDVAPLYADWVKTYADPGFESLAARLEELLDRHATDSSAVRGNYAKAMALEYGFFDANA